MAERTDFVGGVASDFSEHYDEVRGYIREQVSRYHIANDLRVSSTKPKLRIADVGGGEGRNAAWLASFEHKVAMFDPSSDYVAATWARPDSHTFEIHQADAEQALELHSETPYDLVISHVVGAYQANLQEYLSHLSAMTRHQGTASIMEPGLDGKIARAVHRQDSANLASLRENGTYRNNLGIEVTARTPEEYIRTIEKVGFKVLRWYGIRIFTDDDHRKIKEVESSELEALVAEEIRASSTEDIRGMGQLLQFIVRKR